MFNQIVRWLRQPNNILRFVCTVSSIVGFLSYAPSSSFNHLYGKWNLWKIILYTIFSFIICLAIAFANKWQTERNPLLKAHLVFLVLELTTAYSFFIEKLDGKPDVYSLVSSTCFTIMSLGLSKLSHFGIEVDLLYFFCTFLTLQLTKVKWFLAFAGVGFSFFLHMLRFYFPAATESDNLGTQYQDYHFVAIPVNADSEEPTNYESVPIINFNARQENDHITLPEEATNSNAPPENRDTTQTNLRKQSLIAQYYKQRPDGKERQMRALGKILNIPKPLSYYKEKYLKPKPENRDTKDL